MSLTNFFTIAILLQIVLLSAIMGDHAGQTEVVFVPKVTKENSAKKVLKSHVMSNLL